MNKSERKPDDSPEKGMDGSEEAPEVYIVKKTGDANSGGRREFIANSIMAGAAISLGVGQLTSCEKDQETDKVTKSIRTITTKYWYAGFQFSPDGKILATYGSAEAEVSLWSIPDGKLIKILNNVRDYSGVKGLQFTSDGKYLVVDVYTQINIWSIPDGVLLKTLEGDGDPRYQYQIYQLELNPDGKTIAYKKYPETTIKICSIPDGALLNTIDGSGMTKAFFQFSPDGNYFISAYNGTLKIWTFPDLTLINTVETEPEYLYFEFNPDGKSIAAVDKGKIKLWTFPEGNLFKTIEADANWAFFKFSPDGKILVSRGSEPVIKLWSLPGGEIYYNLSGHTENVHDICFSMDGNAFASCQADSILLWSLKDGGVALRKTITENVDDKTIHRNVCISPDGKTLASSYGHTILLWSMPDGTVIPAGSCTCDTVCTCNTVSSGNGGEICTCNTVDVCSCNAICTCNAVCECDVNSGGGGGSYWYPN
jgi:WD40 repeat protein